MQNSYFENGMGEVGDQMVPFHQIVLQDKFSMFVPESFVQDTHLEYRYTYLSNKAKSPLGIAIRFASVSDPEALEKMIANYFGPDAPPEQVAGLKNSRVLYRESANSGAFLSIYSMRFAVVVDNGALFGCFNCSDDFAQDWKPAVLAMLQNIEQL